MNISNSISSTPVAQQDDYNIFVVFTCVLSVAALIICLIIIHIIWKERFQRAHKVWVTNTVVSQIVLLLVATAKIVSLCTIGNEGHMVVVVCEKAVLVGVIMIACNMTVLKLEKYFYVCHAIQYNQGTHTKFTIGSLCLTWLGAIGVGVSSFCWPHIVLPSFIPLLIVILLICFFIIVLCGVLLTQTTWRHIKEEYLAATGYGIFQQTQSTDTSDDICRRQGATSSRQRQTFRSQKDIFTVDLENERNPPCEAAKRSGNLHINATLNADFTEDSTPPKSPGVISLSYKMEIHNPTANAMESNQPKGECTGRNSLGAKRARSKSHHSKFKLSNAASAPPFFTFNQKPMRARCQSESPSTSKTKGNSEKISPGLAENGLTRSLLRQKRLMKRNGSKKSNGDKNCSIIDQVENDIRSTAAKFKSRRKMRPNKSQTPANEKFDKNNEYDEIKTRSLQQVGASQSPIFPLLHLQRKGFSVPREENEHPKTPQVLNKKQYRKYSESSFKSQAKGTSCEAYGTNNASINNNSNIPARILSNEHRPIVSTDSTSTVGERIIKPPSSSSLNYSTSLSSRFTSTHSIPIELNLLVSSSDYSNGMSNHGFQTRRVLAPSTSADFRVKGGDSRNTVSTIEIDGAQRKNISISYSETDFGMTNSISKISTPKSSFALRRESLPPVSVVWEDDDQKQPPKPEVPSPSNQGVRRDNRLSDNDANNRINDTFSVRRGPPRNTRIRLEVSSGIRGEATNSTNHAMSLIDSEEHLNRCRALALQRQIKCIVRLIGTILLYITNVLPLFGVVVYESLYMNSEFDQSFATAVVAWSTVLVFGMLLVLRYGLMTTKRRKALKRILRCQWNNRVNVFEETSMQGDLYTYM